VVRTPRTFVRLILGGYLGLLAVAFVAAADDPKRGAAKDPPGTEQNMEFFRKWFKDHANKDDNTMGRVEAAKAFGYSTPLPAGFLGKSADGDSKTSKPAVDDKKYEKRKDYQFLSKADKDGDEKVSKDEFESWAHEHAVEMAKETAAEQKGATQAAKTAQQQMQKMMQRLMRGR